MIVFNIYLYFYIDAFKGQFVHLLLEIFHGFCLVIDHFHALLLHHLKIFPNRHQTDRLAKCKSHK